MAGTKDMDENTRRKVSSAGGLAVSKDRAHMARIGRIGGLKVSQDREHMARIGRIGGAAPRAYYKRRTKAEMIEARRKGEK